MERNLIVFFVLFLSLSVSSCSAYFSGDAYPVEDLTVAPTGDVDPAEDLTVAPTGDVDPAEDLTVAPAGGARVYIVTVEWHKSLDIKHFAIRTLTSVLGSEVAANKALVYVYDYVFPGFAAKLTPIEAFKLKKQPGILRVIPDTTYHLMSMY